MRGAKDGTQSGFGNQPGIATERRDDAGAERQSRLDTLDIDRLHYMADLIVELQSLASDMRLDILERMLGLAHVEALRATADAEHQTRASRSSV